MSERPPLPEPLSVAGLRPLLALAAGLDLTRTASAEAALEAIFPLASDLVTRLRAAFRQGVEQRLLCAKGDANIAFSRILRPGPESFELSVDAVNMRASGSEHVHPRGEVDLCLAAEGDPRFDGRPEGWVVYGPGSRHVPTVTGGRMHIIYLLPGGAFEMVTSAR